MDISCGGVTDLAPDCANPSSPGVKNIIWIYELEEWIKSEAGASIVVASDVITALALTTVGAFAARVELMAGVGDAVVTPSKEADGTPRYTNDLGMISYAHGATDKAAIMKYENGRYVAVQQIMGGDAEDSFQVYGRKNGLVLEDAITDTKTGVTTGRLRSATAPQAEFEPRRPINIWSTDNETTKAILVLSETPVS